MRRILYCLSLLLLAACIDVDDFGPYWDKGGKEEGLYGTWKMLDKPRLTKSDEQSTIVLKDEGQVMGLTFLDEGQEPEHDLARTLHVDRVSLLMVKPEKQEFNPHGGMLVYYVLREDGDLSFFTPDKGIQNDFLKTYKGGALKKGEYNLKIGVLDEAALKDVLAMVNTPGAFVEFARYRKQGVTQ